MKSGYFLFNLKGKGGGCSSRFFVPVFFRYEDDGLKTDGWDGRNWHYQNKMEEEEEEEE